jgi:hypothetical protein
MRDEHSSSMIMNALITGISAFFFAALGTMCPHDVIYVPALLIMTTAGGFVGGTIFSLQSEGVYDLRIRVHRSVASIGDAKLAGIWAYGLVGIPAGAIALLITAPTSERSKPFARWHKQSRRCARSFGKRAP